MFWLILLIAAIWPVLKGIGIILGWLDEKTGCIGIALNIFIVAIVLVNLWLGYFTSGLLGIVVVLVLMFLYWLGCES